MDMGIRKVKEQRIAQKDSFFFNWGIDVPLEFQQPFVPTHERWRGWTCTTGASRMNWRPTCAARSPASSPATSRRTGMRRIEAHGPFEIHGDPDIMQALDALLRAFVEQRRMKISGEYRPCYRVVS